MARTYLGWSIAAAVVCFLPIGLVAVWYGSRVMVFTQAGNMAAAQRASTLARRWLIVTVVVGLLAWLVIAAVLALLGATAPWVAN